MASKHSNNNNNPRYSGTAVTVDPAPVAIDICFVTRSYHHHQLLRGTVNERTTSSIQLLLTCRHREFDLRAPAPTMAAVAAVAANVVRKWNPTTRWAMAHAYGDVRSPSLSSTPFRDPVPLSFALNTSDKKSRWFYNSKCVQSALKLISIFPSPRTNRKEESSFFHSFVWTLSNLFNF